jgi:hypothetical protein
MREPVYPCEGQSPVRASLPMIGPVYLRGSQSTRVRASPPMRGSV